MVSDKNNFDFQEQMAAACEGLVYTSETDSPIEPFSGRQTDAVRPDILLEQIDAPSGTVIEEADLDEFFERLAAEKEWFGEAETARAKKFLELYKLLEENLSERKLFRLGTTRIEIYAVGRDNVGRLAGVKTSAVET